MLSTSNRLSLAAALVVAATSGLSAQTDQQCAALTIPVSVREHTFRTPFVDFTSARLVEADGTTVVAGVEPIPITSNKLDFTAARVDLLRRFHDGGSGGRRKLLLTASGRNCAVNYSVAAPPTGNGSGVVAAEPDNELDPPRDRLPHADQNKQWAELPAIHRLYTAVDCELAGRDWAKDLYRERHQGLADPRKLRNARFTAILIRPGGGTCYMSRPYGVTGDAIHIGVFSDDRLDWEEARFAFTRCTLESETPAILVSTPLDRVSGVVQGAADRRHSIIPFQGRDCHNADVEATITSRPPEGGPRETETVVLQQHRRYRAGVQLGTLFANTHQRTYGVQTASDTVPRIYDKGPAHNGPEYFASAVIYGLPHYISDIFEAMGVSGEPYRGREVIHDRAFLDRIGGIFGIGLPDPRKRVVLGLSFEVLPGFNVTGTHNWYRTTRLAGGLAVDSVFRGAENTIPMRDVWRREVTFGLSMDATYFTSLLVK